MPRIFDNIELDLLPVLRKTLKSSNQVDISRETLEILLDKKLAKELLKRRKDAFVEMKKGVLMETKELFRELA